MGTTVDSTIKMLADFIQAERNIYAQCPNCEEIHRLNEFKIFYGTKPPKDLLDQLRAYPKILSEQQH
ncbi:MAG: hypothetical protein QW136_02240 [Nitrososphaerales archaeon]